MLIPPPANSHRQPPAGKSVILTHQLPEPALNRLLQRLVPIIRFDSLGRAVVDKGHQHARLAVHAAPHVLEAIGVFLAGLGAGLEIFGVNIVAFRETVVVGVIPVLANRRVASRAWVAELVQIGVEEGALEVGRHNVSGATLKERTRQQRDSRVGSDAVRLNGMHA